MIRNSRLCMPLTFWWCFASQSREVMLWKWNKHHKKLAFCILEECQESCRKPINKQVLRRRMPVKWVVGYAVDQQCCYFYHYVVGFCKNCSLRNAPYFWSHCTRSFDESKAMPVSNRTCSSSSNVVCSTDGVKADKATTGFCFNALTVSQSLGGWVWLTHFLKFAKEPGIVCIQTLLPFISEAELSLKSPCFNMQRLTSALVMSLTDKGRLQRAWNFTITKRSIFSCCVRVLWGDWPIRKMSGHSIGREPCCCSSFKTLLTFIRLMRSLPSCSSACNAFLMSHNDTDAFQCCVLN